MNIIKITTDTGILSENINYSFLPDILSPEEPTSRITVSPQEIKLPPLPLEDLFEKKTAVSQEVKNLISEEELLKSEKQYYNENKETLLKKYKGKYIAIFNNKVIGSDADFSKLAKRVYKKYGYQTIYMPFVEVEEKIVKIPSPRIKNF